MLAIRIPYPARSNLSLAVQRVTVDFPERHFSYAICGCREGEFERYALEVLKAIDSHPPGTEPERLEITLPHSN
jgi:hypothetical protein